MQYEEKSVRSIMMYKKSTQEVREVLRFDKKDPIVSHVKLTKNAAGEVCLLYVKAGRQILLFDVASKSHSLVSIMPDSILALHVRQNVLRPADRANDDPEA